MAFELTESAAWSHTYSEIDRRAPKSSRRSPSSPRSSNRSPTADGGTLGRLRCLFDQAEGGEAVNKRKLVSFLGLMAVVLAGCASSSSTNGTTTSSTTTTTSGPSQNVATDKALAVAANLKLSDFPAGWTSTPKSSMSTGPNGVEARTLTSCLHTNLSVFSNSATRASSPKFTNSSGDTVSSSVNYLPVESQAQAEIAVLESPRFPSCFTTAVDALVKHEKNNRRNVESTLPAHISIGQPTAAQMSFRSFGDSSIANRVTVPVSDQGLSRNVYFDLIAVQEGRALAGLFFGSTLTPFDPSMEEQLTSAVVGRLVQT
jgi:hypothetical protein